MLGSIAACLTLTISIYAEAMGVNVEDIQVDVEGDLNSAGMKGSAGCAQALTGYVPTLP